MNSKDIMTKEKEYIIKDFDMPKEIQKRARLFCHQYNTLSPEENDKKRNILSALFGECSSMTFIEPTFYCDYGINIHTHGLCVINFNCVILDTSPVDIGENCFIAPNCVIACSGHPIDGEERSQGYLTSKPIHIGKDVWIGANSTICPGVIIGDDVVIGAGSVVTKDIPSHVVAFGNPCKVHRKITSSDRLLLKESLMKEKE